MSEKEVGEVKSKLRRLRDEAVIYFKDNYGYDKYTLELQKMDSVIKKDWEGANLTYVSIANTCQPA